jgi:aspartyl-tRNA(Asn)/glutamyl-tRNA(Gln) amidotransferase subunit C
LSEYIRTNIEAIKMNVSTDLILRLEKLANLQLTDPERERFAGDLSKIMDMVDQLQGIDTTGVAPLVYLSDTGNALRPDQVEGQLTVHDALANAPQTDGTYFKVPKVSKKG